MVTSEKGIVSNITKNVILVTNSSVAIFSSIIDIELCQLFDTSIKQSLALYLGEVNCRQNGGRITDQANASTNLDDSGNRKYFHAKFHSQSILDRQLNSVLLITTHSKMTIRTLFYNTREKIKTFRKDKKAQYIK